MILIFLGSWRSTIIIAVSIPLSILTSIIVLSALGETINIMTLGGLALAVGILVDDATVAIENINWHLEQGKELEPAILDGAEQIAIPAFVSTICICIVFVPMFFLTGVARYLFVPMAEAVVFAMLASYVLSRTLVPTMAKYLLKAHEPHEHEARRAISSSRVQRGARRAASCACAPPTARRSSCAWSKRVVFAIGFLLVCVRVRSRCSPAVGQDFFPAVDSGQFKLHLRAPTGTRIEETAALCDASTRPSATSSRRRRSTSIIDNIGLPYSGLNLSYSNSAPIGARRRRHAGRAHAEPHSPTAEYIHDLRLELAHRFPSVQFSFIPSDIVSQILSFGLPAPIDVQIVGRDYEANRRFAANAADEDRADPGHRRSARPPGGEPAVARGGRRSHARGAGRAHPARRRQQPADFAERQRPDLADLLAEPVHRRDLQRGDADAAVPDGVAAGSRDDPGVGERIGRARRSCSKASPRSVATPGMAVVSHYNVQPVIDIFGSVQGRDLGGVAR